MLKVTYYCFIVIKHLTLTRIFSGQNIHNPQRFCLVLCWVLWPVCLLPCLMQRFLSKLSIAFPKTLETNKYVSTSFCISFVVYCLFGDLTHQTLKSRTQGMWEKKGRLPANNTERQTKAKQQQSRSSGSDCQTLAVSPFPWTVWEKYTQWIWQREWEAEKCGGPRWGETDSGEKAAIAGCWGASKDTEKTKTSERSDSPHTETHSLWPARGQTTIISLCDTVFYISRQQWARSWHAL